MEMRAILEKNKQQIALVIGNGINRYGAASDTNSWHNLLFQLAREYMPKKLRAVPIGVSLTEFYDVLELKTNIGESPQSLQQKFCDLMFDWRHYSHHRWIVNWALNVKVPIVTTNFEKVLSDAVGCSLYRTKKGGFTDFYPWESYYGKAKIQNPAKEFGIWHINGMQHYHRSVRLGLTHYMGSVERARGLLYKEKEHSLFSGKNKSSWAGASSWLHIIFNCPLLIFGLSLCENEVFLRWLLIERARYYKRFPDRKKDAWYVYSGDYNDEGKKFFLEGVGIQPVHVSDYNEIYGEVVWQ